MPGLRVLSWNANGSGPPRGSGLSAAAVELNDAHPDHPLQLVVCQAVDDAANRIRAAMAGMRPFAKAFQQPPEALREHAPAPEQPFRTSPTRTYWMTHMAAGGESLDLAAMGDFDLVRLDPEVDDGVASWIEALALSPGDEADVRQCAANMRWPAYRRFRYGPAAGDVHFFTWRAPLAANWSGACLSANTLAGGGLWKAHQFLQHSVFLTDIRDGLSDDDVIVIAGDLKLTADDLASFRPDLYPGYADYSDGVGHVLAFSPSPALAVVEGRAFEPPPLPHGEPSSPHRLVSARVVW